MKTHKAATTGTTSYTAHHILCKLTHYCKECHVWKWHTQRRFSLPIIFTDGSTRAFSPRIQLLALFPFFSLIFGNMLLSYIAISSVHNIIIIIISTDSLVVSHLWNNLCVNAFNQTFLAVMG